MMMMDLYIIICDASDKRFEMVFYVSEYF